MEINPLNIFMFLLRMAPTIITVVIIAVFFSLLGAEIRTDDVERASVELAENLFASPELTAGKYTFNPSKLALYDQSSRDRKSELPFLRFCGTGYFVTIEDLQSGQKWEFGYDPPSLRGGSPVVSPREDGVFPYIINSPERTFFASVWQRDDRRFGNFYGTTNPADVEVITYETWLTRATCTIERAFSLKENFTIASVCEKSPTDFCTFSLKRNPDATEMACIFAQSSSGLEEYDCRYLPTDVNFQQLDVVFADRDPHRLKITAYPIKEGATIPNCADIQTSSAIANKNDNVQTVLLCAEKIGTGGESGVTLIT